MAITKAINKQTKSHAAMRNCIEYVLRESKIKDGLVEVTGPYAYKDVTYDLVYQSFLDEKRLWNKDNGRMYAHHVISFHKDEDITPEQALEFGKAFVDNTFKNHQTLISVHQDKNHIHIHFVTNSVSYIDGYKLHIRTKDLEAMKQLTNDMCKERGLTVAQKGKHFDGTDIKLGELSAWSKDKYNMIKNDIKNSFVADCFNAIITVVKNCCSKEQFIEAMFEKGWNVNWKDSRKNITFENAQGQKVRDSNLTKTFKANISKESLETAFISNQEKLKAKEVDDYCEKVAKEIEVPKKSGEEKKMSIADRIKAKQAVVDAYKATHSPTAKKSNREIDR